MPMIGNVEIWNGNQRIAEELEGNVEAGIMYLGPRGKIPDDLDTSIEYTAWNNIEKWTVNFQAFDDEGATFYVL